MKRDTIMERNEIETTQSLWEKCESLTETIDQLNEQIDYAAIGLQKKLRELLGLMMARLGKENEEGTTVLVLEDRPYDVVAVYMTEDEIWFCVEEGEEFIEPDLEDVDIFTLREIVEHIKKKYNM